LKQITDRINQNIFSCDVLCRYGGDEFVLFLTKTSNQELLQAMEKIRQKIDEYTFVFDRNLPSQQLTISVGLVNFGEVPDKRDEEILKLADDRLFIAKSLGRNRIVYSDSVQNSPTPVN